MPKTPRYKVLSHELQAYVQTCPLSNSSLNPNMTKNVSILFPSNFMQFLLYKKATVPLPAVQTKRLRIIPVSLLQSNSKFCKLYCQVNPESDLFSSILDQNTIIRHLHYTCFPSILALVGLFLRTTVICSNGCHIMLLLASEHFSGSFSIQSKDQSSHSGLPSLTKSSS